MTAAPGTAAGKKTRGKGGRKNTAGKKRKQRERVCALRIAAVALSLVVLLSALLYFVNRRMEKRTYRLAYAETIRQESAAFGLDPYLVAAVIHCESSGRADAHSPKGACGLMQIMPATGAWIAEKLAIPSFTEEMLYEPEQNIRFGCWYLSYLMQKYDGETDLALMIALYIAMDSFGTACNVTGDGAISLIIDRIFFRNNSKDEFIGRLQEVE